MGRETSVGCTAARTLSRRRDRVQARMGVVCISSIRSGSMSVFLSGQRDLFNDLDSVRLVGNHAVAPGLLRSDQSNVRRTN